MSSLIRVLLACTCLLFVLTGQALAVTVENVRVWSEDDRTRVVLDLSAEAEHRLFTLDDPDRVVIDVTGGRLADGVDATMRGLLQGMRSANRDSGELRLVFDLSGTARAQSFLVKPNGDQGHRLVVDLQHSEKRRQTVRSAPSPDKREFVVAIDAGHGGRDPGAIGPGGTQEKMVVLEVAKKLAYLLEKEPGIRPLLIRDSDTFVPLAERREKARSSEADIFISLHADAVANGGPRGSSVYTLSQSGASSQAARLVAQRENAADLIGGVSLSDKDDLVRSVLVDLSRASTQQASIELAADVLTELSQVGPIHKRDVERAGFVVLQSLDMPSVLVELAFISNPVEERQLRRPDHQWDLARAVAGGVASYRDRHQPATRMASAESGNGSGREHVVRRGETLSGIAQKHAVSVRELRSANELNGDRITVGSKLRIP